MSEAIFKFEPKRTIALRGFDRRGAAASMTAATATGFKVSGLFSDVADFAVLVLADADDVFGHLQTTKYLPDFSYTGVVIDFDLAISNGMYPGSSKFPSVPWNALSFAGAAAVVNTSGTAVTWVSGSKFTSLAPGGAVTIAGVTYTIFAVGSSTGLTLTATAGTQTGAAFLANGTAALNITSTTGQVAASRTYTVNGTPATFDRVQLIFLGNNVFDYIVGGGDTTTTVATQIAAAINAAHTGSPIGVPITATSSGPNFTVTCTQPGQDGNVIELLELHKTATTFITPAGASKLTGGTDPTSFHVTLDFTALGLTSFRQCWLTFAPSLPIDSSGSNSTLVPFTAKTFSYAFSNWAVTDPSTHTPLKVAGPGSVIIASRDQWAKYSGSGWSEQSGFYYKGFARVSPTTGDAITIFYSSQFTHDLYVGSSLSTDRGIFSVTVDGVAQPDLDTYLSVGAPLQTRRSIATGVAAGKHTVILTVKSTHNAGSSGTNCYFDYLQAVVASDVQDPATTYANVGLAFDFDTDQTYKLPPQRSIWIARKAGLLADIDFYAGVFFALKRIRSGGSFHQATVTLSGTWGTGTGFGDGDAVFVNIAGTSFGAAFFPADTLATLAQRLVNGINGLFVGVCAAPTGTAGQFTITTLSPINGFTLVMSKSGTITVTTTGDINAGNEGTWQVDSSQTSPLNQAFSDYLADFCAECVAQSMTTTVAYSQELLAPPDVNTSGGAWSQRFASGATVLTATGFGSWGAGFVESVAAGPPVTIQQTAHGYVTGNTVHIAGSGSGIWAITVTDADHYQLTTLISGGYTPSIGDATLIDLQTTQCAFNGSTLTPYLSNAYLQTAGIMNTAGLTPWLQFGEVGHWFFSEVMSLVIAGFSNSSGLIKVQTSSAHGFSTGQTVILAGTRLTDGTKVITVVDSTHFTVNSSTWPGGSPAASGTVSGGGMAFYDANQVAAASASLGRALASFYTQDDDPTINSSADANFLAGRITTHVNAMIAAVLAAFAGAKFEVLWPYDVNYSSVYATPDLPYPQGGRLNHAVNLPAAWHTKSGSGLDRFKVEGLSWGSFYRNGDIAQQTIEFPYRVLSWSQGDTKALCPWFNGGCPWVREYLFDVAVSTPSVNFWAFDHLILLSWPVQPLPLPKRRVHKF